ncbi:glycosyltransferase family protein [Bordetella genomosp. 10]|nr:glycosyltransferase family protein [Bordetella genomosp. 10]
MEVQLFAQNTKGLSSIYNSAIDRARDQPAILVFIHDDVQILDFFFSQKLRTGLQHYDVLGVAGNIRRLPRQPAWAFVDDRFTWDDGRYLSGTVGHIKNGELGLAKFGEAPAACRLLDGLILAADSERLLDAEIRFDERFAFHFYDMAFCRDAEEKGLTMGTWPLSLTHESDGAYGTDAWHDGYWRYLQKYGS